MLITTPFPFLFSSANQGHNVLPKPIFTVSFETLLEIVNEHHCPHEDQELVDKGHAGS